MNVQDLIQAHKLYANWQRSSPEADFDNACSMAILSTAPAASPAELQARHQAIGKIWCRQRDRMLAAKRELLASGVDAEALTELVLLVSETASSATLQFVLNSLMTRDEGIGNPAAFSCD